MIGEHECGLECGMGYKWGSGTTLWTHFSPFAVGFRDPAPVIMLEQQDPLTCRAISMAHFKKIIKT